MPKGVYIRTEETRKALRARVFKVGRKAHTKETRKKISLAHKGVPRPERRGENHPGWKGDKLGYFAAHSYLREYHSDKKTECIQCGSNKKLQFAKKKGSNYTRNIEDYLILCTRCHLIYDGLKERTPWNKGYKKAKPIPCVQCKNLFLPVKRTVRFCSKACVGISRRLPHNYKK